VGERFKITADNSGKYKAVGDGDHIGGYPTACVGKTVTLVKDDGSGCPFLVVVDGTADTNWSKPTAFDLMSREAFGEAVVRQALQLGGVEPDKLLLGLSMSAVNGSSDGAASHPTEATVAVAAAVPLLAFTRAGSVLNAAGNGVNSNDGDPCWRSALCADHVMSRGKHSCEFTIVSCGAGSAKIGVAPSDLSVDEEDISKNAIVGLDDDGRRSAWTCNGFAKGDVIGFLLDKDAGTLSLKINGTLVGGPVEIPSGELCWAAGLDGHGHSFQISGTDPTAADVL
jgi:hypothetical protein